MKSKSLMLLLVAGGCGLVAMLGVQQMLGGDKQVVPKVRILVAKTDIERGIQLDKTNVTVKEVSADAVPDGAVTKEEQYAERALKRRAIQGQTILLTDLGNRGEYGLDMVIPADMRVTSVPVTLMMTHSGLLKPGSFVDVNAAIETQQSMNSVRRTEVKTVLQCIQVFAIDSLVAGSEEAKDNKPKESKTVSFLVYPRQAQVLQLAYKQSNGNLQFAMRGSSDKNLANSSDLTEEMMNEMQNSLMGIKEEPERKEVVEKPVPVAPTKARNAFRSYIAPETPTAVISAGDQASRRKWTIEIFNGEQRETQELDWPEDLPGEAKRTVSETTKTSADVSKSWKNPLMKMLSRESTAVSAPAKEDEAAMQASPQLKVTVEALDQVSKALNGASALNDE